MAYPRHSKHNRVDHQRSRAKQTARDRRATPRVANAAAPAPVPAKPKKSGKLNQASSRRLSPKVSKALVDYGIVHVRGISDQHGKHWASVTRGGVTAYGSVDLLMSDAALFFADLARQGVRILVPAMRRDITLQVDNIQKWSRNIYVADTSGYHCGAWVMPDAQVLGTPSAPNFRVNLGDRVVPLATAGSLKGQQATIARFVNGQPVLVLAAGVALVGSVLDLLSLPNIGVELTGESSTGKSTALDQGASFWGAPLKERGTIALSLRGTLNGFEQQMRARNSAVFLGDEANLLGGFGTRQRGGAQADLAFMLGEGVEKARWNDLDIKRVRFGFLITSNASMGSQLRGEDRDSVDAVLVRLLTMPSDAGAGMGVFDHLPEGFASSGEAIAALKVAQKADYGHIACVYLQAFLKARQRDEAGLTATAKERMETFIERTHVDPNEGINHRRAEALAAIYVALSFAVDWGVLPLRKVRSVLLACYQRMVAFQGQAADEPTAIERVRAYAKANKAALKSHKAAKGKKMSDEVLAAHPGLKARREGSEVLLISPERWKATFGNDARRMLEELKRQSRLQTTGAGFQAQIKVRANKAHDRMYAILMK